MTAEMKKYSISFPARTTAKRVAPHGFYELAKKHIVKGKRGGPADLSARVDEVVYGD